MIAPFNFPFQVNNVSKPGPGHSTGKRVIVFIDNTMSSAKNGTSIFKSDARFTIELYDIFRCLQVPHSKQNYIYQV